MKTKLYTIFFLVLMSKTINAQGLPQVVPPSPEASALFKFNEIPVSLSNGLHNTSIPLLEISSGGLTIPISLSYHSRGVQVNEIASRVGTGWALSYGGMISRQIRSKADESTNLGYFSTSSSTPAHYSDSNGRINESLYTEGQSGYEYFDYYPDKYMISTNFFSGEFYFDKNTGTILTQKFSDIKIVPQYDGKIIGFQVTDNQGNNYYFGNVEVTNIHPSQFTNEYEWTETTYTFNNSGLHSSNGNNTNFEYSSWFLKKIVTNTSEVIEFIYEDETTSFIRRGGDTDEIWGQNSNGDPAITNPVTCHFSKIQSHQKRLSEIRFDGGKVVFVKSEIERDDLQGGFSLDKIQLFNNTQFVKEIKLNYFYTNHSGFDNINSNNVLLNDEYAKKRLFLESVEFKDGLGANTEKSYQFEYDSQVLPSRHSNSIDFWGYYNGKNRGNFINWGNTNFDDAVVDPIKVQAGLLKKIIYPTGGYTTFEYEPNIVLNHLPRPSSFSESGPVGYKIPNTNPIDYKEVTLGYFNNDNYNTTNGKYEKTFTVSAGVYGRCQVNINTSGSFRYFCYLFSNNNYISLQNLGTNTIELEPGTYTLVFDPDVPNWSQYTTFLPDGTPDFEANMERFFLVHLHWDEAIGGNYIYAPGNRIKKISNFTAESNLEFSKLFSYENESDNFPNGAIFSTSNYRIIKHMVGQYAIYDHAYSPANGLFGAYSKDNFAYHTVNEYFLNSNGDSKDKITNKYSLPFDMGSYFTFPHHPISDYEWLRGLELSKIFYKKENGIFKKVKEITNDYFLNGSLSVPSFLLRSVDFMDIVYPFGLDVVKPIAENFSVFPYLRSRTQLCYPVSIGCNLNYYVYNATTNVPGYRTYFFTGGTLDLHETKVTEYFDNGQEMETVTTYGYDYNNHYNVASVSTTNSFGEISETKYQYASNTSNPVNDAMVAKNMVAIPLLTESYKNGEKLSTVETQYKNWNNILLAPEFIKASKGSAPLETRVIYNLVDPANGNPLQVQKEGGMTICYIWGYNKTQPVAKIENITYSAIPSTRIQAIENATNEANLITALNALRNDTALSNAMVTTYTYKPLVGISTVTDPKGDKQTYHYDGFGRLQYVKDAEENILSENQYHYRTQN